MKIILCLKNSSAYESSRLIEESRNLGESIVITDNDICNISVILENNRLPKVFFYEDDISDANLLLVRSTKNYRTAKAVLARTLSLCGCNTVDNPEKRISVGYASKILSTISRYKRESGIDSYILFSMNSVNNLKNHFQNENITRVLYKPIASSQSRGIKKYNVDNLMNIEHNFSNGNDVVPILLQKIVEIDKEYRVIVKNSNIICAFKKKRRGDGTVKYIRKRFNRLEQFVIDKVSDEGILGVDACKDFNGKFYVIETNRSPMFSAAEKHTNINIAREMLL